MYQSSARVIPETPAPTPAADTLQWLDQALDNTTDTPQDTLMVLDPLPKWLFQEPIFNKYRYIEPRDPFEPDYSGDPNMRWLEKHAAQSRFVTAVTQRFMINNPALVTKNFAFMAKAPQEYYAQVNPSNHTIEFQPVQINAPQTFDIYVKKRHWIRKFEASLQFSQAYVSPNWYQGGNNNLNMTANIYYNVKLNTKYHPNLLFESTVQYKLGVNSSPDDSLRNYSISEDLLQLNTTFGVKAANKWYYSVTAQFKTQIVNSYFKNQHRLQSAFLSPGELTAGLGMTYSHANKKKTFTFDASLAPISYNLKICAQPNDKVTHASYGVPADKKYDMSFGSTAELKMFWQLCKNISYRTRLFAFTDYHYFQADWEHTLSMNVNNFLTTQVYAHLRYDTSTPPSDDPHWHKLQVKEILSIGFAYRFSSL